MKKKILGGLAGLSSLCLSSCGLFYADEPAPKIEITDKPMVLSAVVRQYKDGFAVADSIEVQTHIAIEFLQNAVPTKRESVNDTPASSTVYKLVLEMEENEAYKIGFIYEVERLFGLYSQWYYEIPYYGIYEVSEESVTSIING